MQPDRRLSFARVPLARALRTLPAPEFRLLVLLGLGACPRTRRIWTTPLRLAEGLDLLPDGNAPTEEPAVVDAQLRALVDGGHLALHARSRAALRCYEVLALTARPPDEPPMNLPVEDGP